MPIAFKTSTDNNEGGGSHSDDVVGRFRSGYQTSSGRPMGLDAFRITTGDPDVAAAIADLMGSDDSGVSEWDTSTEEKLQVFTETSELEIIVDPSAIKATLVLWSQRGKKIVETDGTFLIEDGKLTGKEWDGSHKDLQQIKKDAKDGVGPAPSLQVYFRLAESPELGKFKYFSGAWTAIETFNKVEERLAEMDAPARVLLSLERVEFTAKDGTEVSYVRPSLKVLGPAEDVV